MHVGLLWLQIWYGSIKSSCLTQKQTWNSGEACTLHCWIKYELWPGLFHSHPILNIYCLTTARWGARVLSKMFAWSLVTFWTEVKLREMCQRPSRLHLQAEVDQPFCNFSATVQQKIHSFQQLMLEMNQTSWVIRKSLLLRGMFFPLVVIFSLSLSAVSSFVEIPCWTPHRGRSRAVWLFTVYRFNAVKIRISGLNAGIEWLKSWWVTWSSEATSALMQQFIHLHLLLVTVCDCVMLGVRKPHLF